MQKKRSYQKIPEPVSSENNYTKQLRKLAVEQHIKRYFPSKSGTEISQIFNWLDIYHFTVSKSKIVSKKHLPCYSQLETFLKQLASTPLLLTDERILLSNKSTLHVLPNGKEKLILAKQLGII